ncbi:TPA: hypothetical protein ACPZLH_001545 [Yersinia enterocolitica]
MKELDQFTVERLEKILQTATFAGREELKALARIALSAKQAEPVEVLQFIINNPDKDGYIEWADCNKDYFNSISIDNRRVLYTTPPANSPAVPEGWINTINGYLDNDGSRGVYDATGARAYRAKLEQLLAAAPTSLLEGEGNESSHSNKP